MINLKQAFSKKILLIFVLVLLSFFIFNQKLAEFYFSFKLSKWVEKDVLIKDFEINYPDQINIKHIKIVNTKKFKNKNIFEAKNIKLNIDLKTFFFDELVLINYLEIYEPVFYLELVKKELLNSNNQEKTIDLYEDNLGLAEKINSNKPDKIWPKKKKDINFVIINSKILEPRAYLSISPIVNKTEILMSDFEFFKIGNQKGFKHYKDVLEIMLFDILARVKDKEIKSLLKKIYNL
jgi:hypothetical protein